MFRFYIQDLNNIHFHLLTQPTHVSVVVSTRDVIREEVCNYDEESNRVP